jgi:peptidoglycan hydrolase-like protein with peptidoglycan-binding domain
VVGFVQEPLGIKTVGKPCLTPEHLTVLDQENTMKVYFATASLMLMALFGTMGAQTKPDQAPSGTVVDKQHGESNEVQPAPEKIRLTPDVVRAAQQKLNDEGYESGTADGKMGPVTRGAIRKYQQDKGLKETGTLDESTLSHLNVGGGKVMATAPGNIGRGAKAAGHDIKEGHPVAAGKAFGKGVGRAGKAVGEGTKSGVSKAGHKVAGEKKEESTPPPPK